MPRLTSWQYYNGDIKQYPHGEYPPDLTYDEAVEEAGYFPIKKVACDRRDITIYYRAPTEEVLRVQYIVTLTFYSTNTAITPAREGILCQTIADLIHLFNDLRDIIHFFQRS